MDREKGETMTRLQKCLVGVILLELAGVLLMPFVHSNHVPLPELDFSVLEKPTATAIRQLEYFMNPDAAADWFLLGKTYQAFGLYPQAGYAYAQACERAPVNASYQYFMGGCLDHLGETQKASEHYERAIVLSASSPSAPYGLPPGQKLADYCWLGIGLDRLREEDWAAAEPALRKAAVLPRARLMLARVMIRVGRAEEASRLLDGMLRDFPGSMDINQMKSWAEAELGHRDAALHHREVVLRSTELCSLGDFTFPTINEVRSRCPGSFACFLRSSTLLKAGRLEEARRANLDAIQLLRIGEWVNQLAEIELNLGRGRDAIERLRDQCRYSGRSARSLGVLGDALAQQDDEAGARDAWTEAAERQASADLDRKLSESFRRTGDTDSARRYHALEQFQIGKETFLKNDLKAALPYFEGAVREQGDYAPTWFYLGETRRFLHDPSGARQAYQRCLQLNPDFGRALDARSRLPQDPLLPTAVRTSGR